MASDFTVCVEMRGPLLVFDLVAGMSLFQRWLPLCVALIPAQWGDHFESSRLDISGFPHILCFLLILLIRTLTIF